MICVFCDTEIKKEHNKECPNCKRKFLPMLLRNDEFDIHKVDFTNMFQSIKRDGCLIGTSLIQTNEGLIKIQDIVNKKLKLKVLSYNSKTKKLEYKKIISWFNNGKEMRRNFNKILIENNHLICTHNHKIKTKNGWKRSDKLNNDKIMKITLNKEQKSLIIASLFGDGSVSTEKRYAHKTNRLVISSKNEEFLKQKMDCIGIHYKIGDRISGYGTKIYVGTTIITDNYDINIKDIKDKINVGKITSKFLINNMTKSALALWFCDDGSTSKNNGNKKTPLYCLHTEGHCHKQILEIEKYFKSLELNPSIYTNKRVHKNTGKGYFFRFSTIDTFKLMDIFRDNWFKDMDYKIQGDFKYLSPTTFDFKYVDYKMSEVSNKSSNLIKYDIEIESNHNYFANGILVHNCRVEASNSKLLNRSLKFIANPKIHDHFSECFNNLPDEVIVEGEIYEHGKPCREIAGICNSSKGKEVPEGFKVYLFGVYDETMTFSDRYKYLCYLNEKYIKSPKVEVVKQVRVDSADEALKNYQGHLGMEYEGSVIMDGNGIYKNDRIGKNKNTGFKLKPSKEEDLEIIGVTERMENLNESQTNELGHSYKRDTIDAKFGTGIAATFICKYKDTETKVTITGDESSRREIWANKEDYIGRIAIIKSMNHGEMKKLRHSRLVRVKEKVEY